MANPTLTQRAWLVLAQGGWWKASEVGEEIEAEVDTRTLHNRLHVMAARNGNAVKRGNYPHTEYAVTQGCKPPLGLTLAQILEAVAAKAD